MGWITLSLRKLVLTQRVNELEHRLTKLSQEHQSLSNGSSYTERFMGVRKSEAYKELLTNYSNNMNTTAAKYQNGAVTDISMAAQYNVDIQQNQLDYMFQKMNLESIFTAEENALRDEVNQKENHLDLEQEQIETQLEAARAEKEQLDQAISQDIKSSTISLV